MFNKKLVVVIILLMFLLVSIGSASASLKGDVEKYSQPGGKALVDEADKIGGNFVDFVRNIAAIVGVCLIIWAAILFGTAHGDPNKLLLAKRVMGGFIICMGVIFTAEKIVGAVMGFFVFGTAPTP